jgi:hypothetical protein
MQHLAPSPRRDGQPFGQPSECVRAQVRSFAYHRIKPHAPPLVRAPANSFEFHPCERSPQAAHLTVSLSQRSLRPSSECASFRAWTTRVSNPVCSPRFRPSASEQPLATRLRERCSSRYLRISPLHREFQWPQAVSSLIVSRAFPTLSAGL